MGDTDSTKKKPFLLKLVIATAVFGAVFLIPFDSPMIDSVLKALPAIQDALLMISDYARQYMILCLIPAFLISGAASAFLNPEALAVLFRSRTNKFVSIVAASLSGSVLVIESDEVPSMFREVRSEGAGLGPAFSFLYAGPAISILASVFTFKVLGYRMGIARTVLAVAFSFIIGLVMHLLFRTGDAPPEEEREKTAAPPRKLHRHAFLIISMLGILVFVNWTKPAGMITAGDFMFHARYFIAGGFGLLLLFSMVRWYKKDELKQWIDATGYFVSQVLPFLAGGILVTGSLFGWNGDSAIIPVEWVPWLVGGNSFLANFAAALCGLLMPFPPLTEIPFAHGLLGAGMGLGPALALLLAGPSISIVTISALVGDVGWKKMVTYAVLVVGLSTVAGLVFGTIMA